jgi:hypothetical protein
MTLKEKICEPFGGLLSETANELEKITEDFAVEFTEWCVKNELFYSIKYARIETKELLEIFKRKRGL